MLDQLFMQVIDMSRVAGVTIVIVLIARMFLKRFPKFISYALWSVVLFRLLCPVSFESIVSLIPETTPTSYHYTLADESISIAGAGEAAYQAVGDAVNGGLGVQHIRTTELDTDGNVKYVTSFWWEVWVLFGQYVWLVGIGIMLLYSIISYNKIRQKVMMAVPFRENIYIIDDTISPFVMGLFRPRIFLPSSLEEKEQEYILLHEQFHIKRFDHVVKLLAFAALCIHWFNPLVWAAFVLSGKDMEMSCDEAVIKRMGEEIRADYSASLLALATGHRVIRGTPLAFGEGDTKGRIENLGKWKKLPQKLIAVVSVSAIILILCLMANPNKEKYSIEDTQESQNTQNTQNLEDTQSTEDSQVIMDTTPVPPTKEQVLMAREIVLEGMSEQEITRLKENIKVANQQMEEAYVYHNIFEKLEDKEHLYWNYFEQKGDIQIGWNDDGTPMMDYNRFDANNFINLINEMKASVKNIALQNDLQYIIDETQMALETHEAVHVNNIYKMLHDMDYYLLRYGIEDVGVYTQDASLISKYYGMLSVYSSLDNNIEK